MNIVNTSASKVEEKERISIFEKKLKELKKLSFWLEGLEKLESSNKKYIEEYEYISNEKEKKRKDFKKLEFTNKTLNIDFLNSSKNALEKLILQNIKSQEDLTKDLEKLNKKLTVKQIKLKDYDLELTKVTLILKENSESILNLNSDSAYKKTINEVYSKLSIKCNVLSEEINSLKTRLELLQKQLETINKNLFVDNVFFKQLDNEIIKSLEENAISSKEEFLKEVLPREQRDILSKECKEIENEYLHISTLKIDIAKRLKEQKELNLTNRNIEDINSEVVEIQNSIEELKNQKNAEL